MSDCCVRELTLEEEIDALDLDKKTRERIVHKIEKIIDENHKQGDFLYRGHHEIDLLKAAIVEQSKIIAKFALDMKEKNYL